MHCTAQWDTGIGWRLMQAANSQRVQHAARRRLTNSQTQTQSLKAGGRGRIALDENAANTGHPDSHYPSPVYLKRWAPPPGERGRSYCSQQARLRALPYPLPLPLPPSNVISILHSCKYFLSEAIFLFKSLDIFSSWLNCMKKIYWGRSNICTEYYSKYVDVKKKEIARTKDERRNLKSDGMWPTQGRAAVALFRLLLSSVNQCT